MATGYLVTLGDGSLDPGDAISGSQSTFTIDQNLGAGAWRWSGVYQNNGRTYNNIDDTGVYYLGSDGNVYFIPDTYFITSGTATATSAPAYVAPDGVVDGTSGADVIDSSYSDAEGESVGTGNDSVEGGMGNDTINAGAGDDTISGGQGADSILGGDGADTIHGDDTGTIEGETTRMSWAAQTNGGAAINDEDSIAAGFTGSSANGDIAVAVSVTAEENFTGASMEENDALYNYNSLSDTSSIELFGGSTGIGQNASTMTLDFSSNDPAAISDEVMDVTFGIHDIDELVGQFVDQVIITAFDADGNPVAVTLTPGDPNTISVDNSTGTATAVGGSGGAGNTNSVTGFLKVNIAGPVARIVIDYNNIDPAYGNHAIRIGDLQMTTIGIEDPSINNDTIDGGAGNDEIFGGTGDDSLTGGAGDDSVYGGEGADIVRGGAGNDSIDGGVGNDTLYGGGGNDTATGGAGDDTVFLDGGNDTFVEASDAGGNDTVYGGTGADSLDGGTGDDALYGGSGNDTITGGAGSDTLDGGTGSDTFRITDADEADTIIGGEDINGSDIDTVDFSAAASGQGVDVIATGDEAGTYTFDGTAAAGSYTEIEAFDGTDFNDFIDLRLDNSGTSVSAGDGTDLIGTGSGDDTIDAGRGSDSILAGAGNDVFDLGSDSPGVSDGDADIVYLDDGFGDDYILNFDAPIDNGDGTFTGVDRLDVVLLTSPDGKPVNVNNVTVSDDGFGNALLTFPGGETVTVDGIDPVAASDPFYLNAMGIPLSDGTVEGTAGADVIDSAYVGDPDGDRVDNNDAILAGDTGNDDLIYGYGGDDSISAGAGADEVYGGDGDDTINAGAGDDTVFGGAGSDEIILSAGSGSDIIEGGEDVGDGDVDRLTFTDTTGPDGVNVTMTGDEAGTFAFPTDGGDGSFSQIEQIVLTDQNDTFDGTAATGGNTVDGGAGDDSLLGSSGSDSFDGGAGSDTLDGGAGADTLGGGDGADTITGGADADVIYGGAGDVIDGSETGTDNDTLIVSGVDYIDYDPNNPENGIVFFEGGGSLTFTNIENVVVSDRDGTVSGTAGNDVIDASYVDPNDGDQVDDTDAILVGHAPNDDLIEAGDGDDSVTAGTGDDTVFGGAGGDTLEGGTGDDTLFGGDGTDALYAGAGDDELDGGAGSDTFIVGEGFGTDTLTGGEDVGPVDIDVVDAGGMTSDVTLTFTGDEAGTLSDGVNTATFAEMELFSLGSGNDTIIGGAGDELVFSGSGDDSMSGGLGADTFYAGAGNDTVTFSDGDNISGGSGDDTFTLEDLGEASNGTITIDGGAGSESGGDTLNLGGLANLTQAVRDTFVDDGTGSYSGSITLDDGTILNFSEIENIICFTPDTRIATPRGLVAIQNLKVGDMVVTRDHGLQPIRWIEARKVPAVDRFAPVTIRKGVLGGQERDLIVSPQHRVMFQGYRAELLFGESEVLVSAKHLVDGMDVTQDEQADVTYIHMLFDQHEIIYAEGAPTESFHPGDIGFSAVGDQARDELFAIFPELRVDPKTYGSTARRCLKKHEAKLVRT